MPRLSKEASNEYSKLYYSKHKETILQKAKLRYLGHSFKHPRKEIVYDSEKNREAALKYRYNITGERYALMFEEQQGRCATCGRHQNDLKQRLHIDHCHLSGKIRALLCNTCNKHLGIYEKNKEIFEEYLNKFGGK